MSVTTRRTSGNDRLASANLNFLGEREGETDFGVMNCGPAIENDRLSLLGDWFFPWAHWLASVVTDIVKTHERITTLQASLESAKHKDQPPFQLQLDRQVEHLQNYVDELHEIGCDLKDYQMGLVDFIGRHRGHDVCLCWKLGEETIAHWHEIQTGFAGRQPVSVLEED